MPYFKAEDYQFYLVKDEEEIKELRDGIVGWPKEMVEVEDFKPQTEMGEGPYCNYKTKCKQRMQDHINGAHELITWYKCPTCDHNAVGIDYLESIFAGTTIWLSKRDDQP